MALKRDVTYSGRFNAASTEHPQGSFKNRTSSTSEDGSYLEQQWLNDWDGFMSSLLSENGIIPNELVDEVGASQYFEGLLRLREVSPINNDWNGYLDPEHQSNLPSSGGYPGAPGGGEIVYAADEEISFGIFAGSGGATVSSDSDGWIFIGSIYKLFDYTTEQLADIDVTKVPVYLKNQVGAESFLKHNGTSVIVTKVGNQLKVEITNAIFAGSFTKLWRFFVTERVGRVREIGTESLFYSLFESMRNRLSLVSFLGSRSPGVTYTNDGLYPKYVVISTVNDNSGPTTGIELYIDGRSVAINTSHDALPPGNISSSVTYIVNPGATYLVNIFSASISKWHEEVLQ